jgi:hypothetical protein
MSDEELREAIEKNWRLRGDKVKGYFKLKRSKAR